ncbi:MAG: transposase [Streptococcus sp.]
MLHYDIYPNPTDTKTLLPFLESYPHEFKLVVADAGYGSEENLLTLDQRKIPHLIKYGLFDKEQKKILSTKQKPSKLDLRYQYGHLYPSRWLGLSLFPHSTPQN